MHTDHLKCTSRKPKTVKTNYRECYINLQNELKKPFCIGPEKKVRTCLVNPNIDKDIFEVEPPEKYPMIKKRKQKHDYKNPRKMRILDFCGDPCPPFFNIYPPYCKTGEHAGVYIPDVAFEWYKRESAKRAGEEKPKVVTYYAPIGESCYPLGEWKDIKAPIRLVPRKTLTENSFTRISTEFLALLKRHEDWLLNKYPEYGLPPAYIRTKGPMTLAEGYKITPLIESIDPDCNCGPLQCVDCFAVKSDSHRCYPHRGIPCE